MKAKTLSASIMLMLLVVSLMPVSMAEESEEDYMYIEQVRINGDVANDDDTLYVERGDEVKLRVVLQANEEVRHAYMNAYISGYKYAEYEPTMVSASTPTFNVPEGNKRSFDLDLEIPKEIEQKDAKLRLVLFDENSDSIITYNYQLAIHGSDDKEALSIRNFFVSPSDSVEAGRALSFKTQVKNHGNYDLDDVTVKVAIPELDLQTYETIDLLEMDETESFESLLLRIPRDVEEGDYEVVTSVEYDRFQSTEKSQMISVTKSEEEMKSGSDDSSVITMPESVQVVANTQNNKGSLYPILIENKGASSKTYVLSVSGHEEWSTATFEPSSVLAVPGNSKQTAYLRILAHDDVEAGDQILNVEVSSGDDAEESTVLANVVAGEEEAKDDSLEVRQILEWALVALIIILIVLGLIVVFRKMRKNNEDEDEQTYY